MMLNEEELTPEQITIFRLQRTIDAFKKYDNERKKYIHNLELRIQELEDNESILLSGVEGEDDISALEKLRKKCKQQKENIRVLTQKLYLSEHWADFSEELDKERIGLLYKLGHARNEKNKLQTIVRSLKEINSELIAKIFHPADAAEVQARINAMCDSATSKL